MFQNETTVIELLIHVTTMLPSSMTNFNYRFRSKHVSAD